MTRSRPTLWDFNAINALTLDIKRNSDRKKNSVSVRVINNEAVTI